MTHEQLTGTSLPPDDLLFDGNVYGLGWDGNRMNPTQDRFDMSTLPAPDFAIYLINSVKFHCGQIFYIFDEEYFMNQFALFQENPVGHSRTSPLWYTHYLLILAFGKGLVVQSVTPQRQKAPRCGSSRASYEMHAGLHFFDADPIEKTQVLCCAALYLQCLNCRTPAYRMIGQALRVAIDGGMYTEMQSPYLDGAHVQRSCMMWWTVYILERQMSSLMGVPMGIAEECISAPFPTLSGQPQRSTVLRIQVELSQVLAKIDQRKLDGRYLGATQAVLRSIANVTERLNNAFELHTHGAMNGISRISAHLHLLQHQSIILTTRPLLYIFLHSKLGKSDVTLMEWIKSEAVKALLHICVESAQQILRILSSLLSQGLIETFLPFDLDATFTSTIALLIAAAIDASLLNDHSPWSQQAYLIHQDMSSRGNTSAKLVQKELKQLDRNLAQLLMRDHVPIPMVSTLASDLQWESNSGGSTTSPEHHLSLGIDTAQDFGPKYELSTGRLIDLANSLELDPLSWPLSNRDEESM